MRLIDAGKLKSHYSWLPDHSTLAKKDIDDIVDVQPTVDAVEVVRCEKCKYWHIHQGTGGNWGRCDVIGDRDQEGGASIDLATYHDDYCSSGEKKEAT